jgi:hydrogenase expression/formation protein HypC
MGEHDQLNAGSGGCRMCLAIPGRVIEVATSDRTTALVDIVGVRRRVDLGLLQDDTPVPGDWVLIHVGFAMSKISEVEALDQMRMLSMLGEAEAALAEVSGYSLDDSPSPGQSAVESQTAGT